MRCLDCNVDYAPAYVKAARFDERAPASSLEANRSDKSPTEHKSHRTESNLVYHPTVKPLALLRWLARLVTPPNGLVLDPFAGTASVAIACRDDGFRCLSIEQDKTYHMIAKTRYKATA